LEGFSRYLGIFSGTYALRALQKLIGEVEVDKEDDYHDNPASNCTSSRNMEWNQMLEIVRIGDQTKNYSDDRKGRKDHAPEKQLKVSIVFA
jgi:hypothetical protein